MDENAPIDDESGSVDSNDPTRKEEYIKISVAILGKVTEKLPFDIHIQRAPGKFTKIFSNGDHMDQEQLAKYNLGKNVMHLYIHNTASETYSYYVEKLLEIGLDDPKSHTNAEMRAVVNEMISITLGEIESTMKMDQKTLRWAEKSIQGCTKILENDFNGLVLIMKLFSGQTYSMKHAFMVSIFSLLLAKALDYESERTLNHVGLGGLLHDIGLTRVRKELIGKQDLTPEESKEFKEHPQMGIQIVDDLKGIPSEVRSIILQHHEQPNGYGYPNGLYEKDIFHLAKIVTITDVFATLITEAPYKDATFSPSTAIKMMKQEIGHFDRKILKVFEGLVLPRSPKGADPRYNN